MTVRVDRAFFHSGSLERGHAIRDRLDSGHGRTAGRERVEQQEQPDRAGRGEGRLLGLVEWHRLEAAAEHRFPHADADHEEHRDEKAVRRYGEEPTRLLHAAEVAPRDDRDEHQSDRYPARVEAGEDRVHGRHAGGDRDRHREDVVGQQRDAGDLRGQQARDCPW